MTEKSALSAASYEKSAAKSKADVEDAGKDTRAKDSPAAAAAAAKSEITGSGSHSSPKKRRKVNHGKVPSRGIRQGSEGTVFGSRFAWRLR